MIRVAKCDTAALSPQVLSAMEDIVERSFVVTRPLPEIMQHYRKTTQSVALVFSRGKLVGFQFFSMKDYRGLPVLHFSMACRRIDYMGVQHAIGRFLLLNIVPLTHLVRGFGAIGVCNNPIAYRNMLGLGGRVFPDLRQESITCNDPELYSWSISELGVSTINPATGLIENRATGIGLSIIKPQAKRSDGLALAFDRYLGGDLNRGLLVLVRTNVARLLAERCRRFAAE